MKWMIFFYLCTPTCEFNPVTGIAEPNYRRTQRIMFYDNLTEASLTQRRLMMGIKLTEYDIEDNEKVCSEVQLWKIEKEISK